MAYLKLTINSATYINKNDYIILKVEKPASFIPVEKPAFISVFEPVQIIRTYMSISDLKEQSGGKDFLFKINYFKTMRPKVTRDFSS